MSEIITTTGRSLNTVTAEIVAISNQAAQMAYMSMIEIGKRLVEAKELVAHGEWGSWLKNEVNFSQRTANNFMQIYERSLSGANSQTFANLGYSHIVKLLAIPDEELEEFTETHDVQSMSVRQLDQAIKERDEARKNQLAQEAAAEAAEKAKAEAVAQLKEAEAAAAQARQEKERAEQAASAAQAEAASLRKNQQMSNPDVMAFGLVGKQIADDINRLAGYRKKVVAANPDMEAKTRAAMLDLAERLRKAAGA